MKERRLNTVGNRIFLCLSILVLTTGVEALALAPTAGLNGTTSRKASGFSSVSEGGSLRKRNLPRSRTSHFGFIYLERRRDLL